MDRKTVTFFIPVNLDSSKIVLEIRLIRLMEIKMNLSEFVEASLVEIIKGVEQAIKKTRRENHTAVVSPSNEHANYSDIREINFDIAVTVQEENTTKGSSGIKIFSANLGMSGEIGSTNTQISRMTFSIPIAWPSVKINQYPSRGVVNGLQM